MHTDHTPVVHAVLHGGPADFPEAVRLVHEPIEESRIKVPHCGGYEHFERDGDATPTVFRWIGRTKVAE